MSKVISLENEKMKRGIPLKSDTPSKDIRNKKNITDDTPPSYEKSVSKLIEARNRLKLNNKGKGMELEKIKVRFTEEINEVIEGYFAIDQTLSGLEILREMAGVLNMVALLAASQSPDKKEEIQKIIEDALSPKINETEKKKRHTQVAVSSK